MIREVAQEERGALGLGPFDEFDPYALAAAYGISVYTLSDLRDWDLPTEVHEHFHQSSGTWSAALIPIGSARLIVEHDGHALVRRRASIAHELGHHLLEHPFNAALLGENHQRLFDKAKERQADILAGELLIPQRAAQRAAFEGWSNREVALTFGVSEQYAQMQMSGPRVRADRANRKYGRRT